MEISLQLEIYEVAYYDGPNFDFLQKAKRGREVVPIFAK